MNTYKVNLDYESYLFDPYYQENAQKSISMIKEFEYVFFVINKEKCKLKNFREYDQVYLGKMKKLGFVVPEFNSSENNFTNWWGSQLDLELEKKLNSKITSAQIALENKWGMFDGAIVENQAEAIAHIKKITRENWILKNPFGVSGSGHQVYTGQQFSGSHLLEPIHQRVFDIGTTFEMVDGKLTNTFMVLNLNSKNGSFKGGIAGKNNNIFKDYIFKNCGYDLSLLEETLFKVFNHYKKLGANSNIQIDSFVYLEDGNMKLYPLVEVNYRKTMGLVLNGLSQHFSSELIEWKVTHTNEFESNSTWIKLSPEGNRFKSYVRTIA
jgi:hypothetical protein